MSRTVTYEIELDGDDLDHQRLLEAVAGIEGATILSETDHGAQASALLGVMDRGGGDDSE